MKKPKVRWAVSAILFAIAVSCGDGSHTKKTNGTKSSLVTNRSGQSAPSGYSFDGSEGDPIALEKARSWTANYREKNPGSTEAHFFGLAIIKQILAEPGCVGIRMYYAIDDNGQKKIVLVGADANGDNLLPSPSSGVSLASFSLFNDDSNQNIVADFSFPCPSYCNPPNGGSF